MPKRVLLKLSGESLAGEGERGVKPLSLKQIAGEIAHAFNPKETHLCIVLGAGNIWRGAKDSEGLIDRVTSDNMGMLATIINSLALQGALENAGVATRVQTSIEIIRLAEPLIIRKAVRHMEKGRVVIFAGGTGNPYFTTDSAAALRACEVGADILLKATQVDGVYTDDPKKNKAAKLLKELSFDTALGKNLKIMDASALALCREGNIPVGVFNLHKKGSIAQAIKNGAVGTLIRGV